MLEEEVHGVDATGSVDYNGSDPVMVLVEEEVQMVVSASDPDIEEILNGVDLVDSEDERSSLWVLQNIQRFNKMMGVSLEGIED